MPKTAAAAPTCVPHPHEAAWLDHLKRWQKAGVSLAAYARSANIKIHRFYAWKTRLETRGLWKDVESVSFLPVRITGASLNAGVPAPPSGLRLSLPEGVVLEFPSLPDPSFLAELLRQVGVPA
jgi:hypothetical protein